MRCSAVQERGWFEGGPSPSPAATASSPFCCLTGEGRFRDEPSQSRCARQLPREGEPLAEPAGFVLTGQRQEEVSRKPKNFLPLPKPPPSGEVARRSRDGEGRFRDEPSQSRCARQLPREGEPLAEPAGFVLTGQRQEEVSRKPKNFLPLPKPPPSGEVARRSRDGEGLLEGGPSPSPTATALPKKYGGHRIIIALRVFSVDMTRKHSLSLCIM